MITVPADTSFRNALRLATFLMGIASVMVLTGCGKTVNAAATAPVAGSWTGSMEGFGFPFTARFGADGTFAMVGRWQGSHGPVSQEMSGTYTQKGANLDVQVARYVYADYAGPRSRPISPMTGKLTDGGHTLTVSYASENGAFQGGYVFRR